MKIRHNDEQKQNFFSILTSNVTKSNAILKLSKNVTTSNK